jgi:hypothetical protein
MKMIFLILATIAIASLTTPCHALVRILALCITADGQYRVYIQDNQGIGPVRTSHRSASVRDTNGRVVASYDVEASHGIQSASFGRLKYQDSASSGAGFTLEGPSTNFKNYILHVKMNSGGKTGTISDSNLNCTVFGKTVIQK